MRHVYIRVRPKNLQTKKESRYSVTQTTESVVLNDCIATHNILFRSRSDIKEFAQKRKKNNNKDKSLTLLPRRVSKDISRPIPRLVPEKSAGDLLRSSRFVS